MDLLIGAKFKVNDRIALSGGVSVPVDDQEFRPAALGTVAVELAF